MDFVTNREAVYADRSAFRMYWFSTCEIVASFLSIRFGSIKC